MADETTSNETITTEDGTVLEPVPPYSQAHDDMMQSLNAAIEARKLKVAPLIARMDAEETSELIDWLDANYFTFRDEPLIAIHFEAALKVLKNLRDASKL